jgi:hypothetical protein
MNKKLKELSLQAGGSHYPTINTAMQEKFAELIINECIEAVKNTKAHALTTYDKDLVQSTVENCAESIRKHFEL